MAIGDNARVVLEARYLAKDENGKPVETVEGMFRRVAAAIAAPDRRWRPDADLAAVEEAFYGLMTRLEFLPNSPTLMNAGRPLGQLSACFVLPVEDTMEGIFDAIKSAALIHKSGGGTGFAFSRLRPKGSAVNSTGGVASGPVSFMKVFNAATEAVKQGGTRRGANMGILRVDHPDILEFIDCKADTRDITNFNISVGVTEAFMAAVEAGEEYDLVDPHAGTATGRLSAPLVFERIVDAAWRNGEPGIVFLDRMNRDNVVPGAGSFESTNPCGEQPLLPYESCNLGSINLLEMLAADGGEVDWEKLGRTVATAVHFLDNVIDANLYPLPEIDAATRSTRKIGLGVMGWADLLLRLGIPYNSEEAVALADRLMAFVREHARAKSEELARERGSFPLWETSTLRDVRPQRNATVTTIAPTGTLSLIAGVSSGVEPVFGYVYIRNVMDGTELIEVNPVLRAALEERGLYSEELMRRIAAGEHLADMAELPEDIRRVYVSAHDVSPLWHTRMQAAFQRHTDNAVSKTVNFPHDATRDEVAEVYRLAYRLGCKGITIYRDGSRSAQVLNIGKVNKEGDASPGEAAPEAGCDACENYNPRVDRPAPIQPRPRPDVTRGLTERMKIGCGNLYVTVNYDENGICEVFTNTGKAGGCPSQSEATARLVSIALRSGIDTRRVVDELRGIRCPSTIRQPGMKATSCPDAIARVIEKAAAQMETERAADAAAPGPADAADGAAPPAARPSASGWEALPGRIRFCPECGAPVEHEGGCVTCRQCGYSRCG